MIRRLLPSSAFLLLLAAIPTYGAEPTSKPTAPESFMRFVDDNHGGGSLQTADVTFKNAAGKEVHLIAAVHIGEKSYYDTLNEDFKNYDSLLYEMVKPKDMAPPAPGEKIQSNSGVGKFQNFLKDVLDLDYQLDDVDYSAPNFVHADLDKETFEKMEQERGESLEQLMMKEIFNSILHPPKDADVSDEEAAVDLVNVLTHPDMERQIKLVLAKQMGQMEDASMGLDGPGGSVIVTERNKQALKVLGDTLAAGKQKVAIFYGAAHMSDMTKRLGEMGFSPQNTKWNVAWDLAIRPNQPSAMEKLFNRMLRPDTQPSDNR